MHWTFLIIPTLVFCVSFSYAGKVFPISSEVFVMSKFKEINPNIKWDHSNFLVDLSGFYSKCSNIGKKGEDRVDGFHPDTNKSISALVDYTRGKLRHVKAIADYLRAGLPSWTSTSPFKDAIKNADLFGCSVRPGCTNFISFSCLFSPGLHDIPPTPAPTRPPTTTDDYTPIEPRSQAFTQDQYKFAESITGIEWDRSNFLENLSGTEASCDMVGKTKWDFSRSIIEVSLRDKTMNIRGSIGFTENKGSTPAALKTILGAWPKIKTEMIGCSTIPHCRRRGKMFVIVVCIYSSGRWIQRRP